MSEDSFSPSKSESIACAAFSFFFFSSLFKWWISCAVTQQWDFYHIGMQLRGGVEGRGKRKEELTKTHFSSHDLLTAESERRPEHSDQKQKDRRSVLLECVRIRTRVYQWTVRRRFCRDLLQRWSNKTREEEEEFKSPSWNNSSLSFSALDLIWASSLNVTCQTLYNYSPREITFVSVARLSCPYLTLLAAWC